MKRFLVGLVVGLVLMGSQPVIAQTRASVEVHVKHGPWIHYFSCWPNAGEDAEDYMIVYISYPDGLAGYQCDFDYGIEVLPIWRRSGIITIAEVR